MMNEELKSKIHEEALIAQEEKNHKDKVNGWIKTVAQIFLPALIILIIFRLVIGLAPLKGSSMEPTLQESDWVIYNRLSTSPQFGDIIVASKPNSSKLIIKRVIGLPGDTVDIRDGHVYINDVLLDESSYTTRGETDQRDLSFPVTLQADEYILLGDNREVSLDSRNSETGIITKDHILGKVTLFVHFSK